MQHAQIGEHGNIIIKKINRACSNKKEFLLTFWPFLFNKNAAVYDGMKFNSKKIKRACPNKAQAW